MKIKNFFETNDNFTEEEIDIVLNLLDIVRDSLKDNLEDILDSISISNINDLKTIKDEFNKAFTMLKTFDKFYLSLDKYNDSKKWGKYL